MAGQVVGSLDTSALGLVHDMQLDYYGKRAAAASGDSSVHIWDVTDGRQQQIGLLKGHEGPVWKVSWAHPRFGNVLASCGYDMRVIVWKEERGQWQMAYVDTNHTASVNDAEFAPQEYGLRLASASSDGTVSILTYSPDGQWHRNVLQAHAGGAQTLNWAPVTYRDGVPSGSIRLATGGCDNSVRVWKCENEVWSQENPPFPYAHTDWVRDVAWRPDGTSVLATGSWDQSVIIWTQEMEGQPWRQVAKIQLNGKVECLSWSVTGSMLSISFSDGECAVYKEAMDGHYEEVVQIAEQGMTEVPGKMGGVPAPTGGVPGAQQAPSVNNELAQQQQAVMDSFGM
mmetsp:Transcript_105640/g.187838  ORF Transcript_105640/g.187838 Transcript_105640/m.187838 type:complete len:341 (-) Transcript_105640:93-1115(-)|eukprot:CAMPEP_0197639878 /NCGR_PEP_ID=MMETSP1338-20131121/14357_1 /TAXON_ID=43686 ORGANISM="Pelagodinium beii, Strain RCC1491" /NCGR_SAMPLE_ID=MMETSP1338 /ASSEMBLY_ACC=CAM_ASM_000754 /LENGTH=340 /DNA_ID=CAMNT_0043212659 /DNA_START=86 /DNA_END=1108 /DNA_ORIENTATION=+